MFSEPGDFSMQARRSTHDFGVRRPVQTTVRVTKKRGIKHIRLGFAPMEHCIVWKSEKLVLFLGFW